MDSPRLDVPLPRSNDWGEVELPVGCPVRTRTWKPLPCGSNQAVTTCVIGHAGDVGPAGAVRVWLRGGRAGRQLQ